MPQNVDNLGSWTLTAQPFVFEQSSTDARGQFFLKNTNSPDEGELELAAADSSEADVATFTLTVNVNNYLPAVQYDYDLS